MKIIYVGCHHQTNSNDDEGAVVHALRKLGHEVLPLLVGQAWKINRHGGDFVLFNKWDNLPAMAECRLPLVMWYWDLVRWPDTTLERRCEARVGFMDRVLPLCAAAFMTDGDFIHSLPETTQSKCYWLMQGADERNAELQRESRSTPEIEVLLTGLSHGGGVDRESFVQMLKDRYGERFVHVPSGYHGRKLARLIGRSKVVVAPDSPVTNRYWSNRLYLSLGFGAFLLHPYTTGVAEQYPTGVVFYANREDMLAKVDYYLQTKRKGDRTQVARQGLDWTYSHHTYRHRCEAMISRLKFLGM